MTRSRSDFALTGARVFSRLSRCMAGGGNHAREHMAHANGITASTWPKMPFRKPLSFQYRPYGGNDRKTTVRGVVCQESCRVDRIPVAETRRCDLFATC